MRRVTQPTPVQEPILAGGRLCAWEDWPVPCSLIVHLRLSRPATYAQVSLSPQCGIRSAARTDELSDRLEDREQ